MGLHARRSADAGASSSRALVAGRRSGGRVGRPVAKVRQCLSLLKANRLVTYERPTLGAAAWRVTASGQGIADLDGPVPQPLRAFSWTHTVTVSALSAALVAEGVEHRVDHQLKSEVARSRRAQREPREVAVPAFDRWQVPDLLIALSDDRRLAVELEISVKASKRIQTVLSAYAISDWQVIYLARPAVARMLERELEGRQAFAEKRIQVWPAPVLEATETKPARPYGEAAREVAREIRAIVDSSHRPIVDPAPPLAALGNPQAPAGRWGRP